MSQISEKSKKTTYFAARPAEEATTIILGKAHAWFNNLEANGYLEKLRDMWAAYHGAYYSDVQYGHKISFGGEQGELTQLPVNHFRNIATNIKVMITATRPSMEARAVNTDYKSLVQTKLANNLLDYYMREKKLEKYLTIAVEHAVVLGAGFVKMDWNATAGKIYDYIEREEDPLTGQVTEPGYPVYEGDVHFSNLSAFDVVYDSTKESQDHDWVICRTFKNRFDLAAKFPEVEDDILRLPTKSDTERYRFNVVAGEDTDDIPVYEFYHVPTESMPQGRYILFCDKKVVLMDAAMPYDALPIYRISAGEILGTPYGYSPMFDLLPLQDALNATFTTILSNHTAFGVQNILMPRGTDINATSLLGGLNLIEYNSQLGKPEALNLTQTPKEIFDFAGLLERQMETLSGVNSVARGNPEKNLRTGNALALVQSMALQYMSGLQQSYVSLIEDVGTGLIKMLQRFASVPRIAMIVGINNRSEMKEFSGDDLDKIDRIIVDVGNPLAKTTAGRVEMASQMMQMNLITSPEQYLSIINTGQLDSMTEDTQSELLSIRSENELMINGETTIALVTDQHSMHIQEHKYVLADPDLRKDPNLVKIVLDHIQEHIQLLRTSDPGLLILMKEQPLAPPPPPPGMMPPPGMAPPGGPPPTNGPQGPPMPNQPPPPQVHIHNHPPMQHPAPSQHPPMHPGMVQHAPLASSTNQAPALAGIPQPARPPAPFQNMPVVAGQRPPG